MNVKTGNTMKAIGCVSALLVLSSVAYAQVEVDDMYFNAKDRAKEKAALQQERLAREERLDEESKKTYSINPTDSYSSRRVNPEYSSQLKSGTKSESSDSSYFISGYQPTNVNKKLSNNYATGGFAMPYYGNTWGNPYMMNSFGYNGFGYSPYSMWNDPFYGGFGSPYSYGFSPYSSFSMGMGWGFGGGSWYPYSSFGWNMWSPSNLFWNNYYCNSWAWGGGWNSWGNPYYGYYNRYPSQVIIIDNSGRPRVAYGKRNDRSSSLNNAIDNSRSTASYTRTGRETSNGRTRPANNDQAFYDRNWRQNQQVTQQNTRSYWGNESNTTRTYSGGNNNSSNGGRQTQQRTSSWSNDSFNNSNNRSWSAPSNSGSGSRSVSTPTRSAPSGGGGSSAPRSRGRD